MSTTTNTSTDPGQRYTDDGRPILHKFTKTDRWMRHELGFSVQALCGLWSRPGPPPPLKGKPVFCQRCAEIYAQNPDIIKH